MDVGSTAKTYVVGRETRGENIRSATGTPCHVTGKGLIRSRYGKEKEQSKRQRASVPVPVSPRFSRPLPCHYLSFNFSFLIFRFGRSFVLGVFLCVCVRKRLVVADSSCLADACSVDIFDHLSNSRTTMQHTTGFLGLGYFGPNKVEGKKKGDQ